MKFSSKAKISHPPADLTLTLKIHSLLKQRNRELTSTDKHVLMLIHVLLFLLQVIERALTVLKTLPPNMAVLPQQSPMQIDHTVFYRKQAWLVVQVT